MARILTIEIRDLGLIFGGFIIVYKRLYAFLLGILTGKMGYTNRVVN